MNTRILCLLLALLSLACLAGCQADSSDRASSIQVNGLAELETMRQMAVTSDQDALTQYLPQVQGGGAKTQEDLVHFLSILDGLPIVQLLDGTVGAIVYTPADPKGNEVLMVTTNAAGGQWVRLEFWLSAPKDQNIVEAWLAAGNAPQAILPTPVNHLRGRIKLYTERTQPHSSGVGYVTSWLAQVDEHILNIVYYSGSEEITKPQSVFTGVQITGLY